MNNPQVRSPHLRIATSRDAAGVLAIYAPIVRESAISFEAIPPTVGEMARRIVDTSEHYPWLVHADGDSILGYAYATGHRSRSAYTWSVEVSAYVHPEHKGRGIGRQLYSTLLPLLAKQGFAEAFAGIAQPNEPSVGFHEAMGFEPIGVYRRVGFKLGRWWDVGWWQRRLRNYAGTEPAPPGRPPRTLLGGDSATPPADGA